MKALITKASDWEWFDVKEVDSIEDVLKIAPRDIVRIMEKDDGKESKDQTGDGQVGIKIYDDFGE